MKNQKLAASVLGLFAMSLVPSVKAISIQLVADNDFAVYAGTSTSITRSIYQNNSVWQNQLSEASSFSFDLQEGENTYYVLAMGGGVEENISGRINGVNLVDVFLSNSSGIQQSNDVSDVLNYELSTVTSGTFTPDLSDVQTALTGATWGSPTVTMQGEVINSNPYAVSGINGQHVGFSFAAGTAVLLAFPVAEVAAPIPEPSSAAIYAGLGALGLVAGRRRRRA